jgi:hypothetical protein
MSTQNICGGSVYTATPVAPIELFPASVERVFNRLACIANDDDLYEPGEERPLADTIAWARRVLLKIVPGYYLRTAEIDVFRGEIHVSWERDSRRVVAFLPSPDKLKIYVEWTKLTGETEHFLRSVDDPRAINPVLKWLYT